jgi:CTP:molybdopterin cytidylyltransferase MocA
MLRGVVRAYAALCGRVTVVVRSESQFTTTLEDLPVTVVANPDADEGIASSIRAAVSSCSDRPAVMIALADEPRVDRALVVAVMNQWQETSAPVVAPRFNGIVGHQVIFDRTVSGCAYSANVGTTTQGGSINTPVAITTATRAGSPNGVFIFIHQTNGSTIDEPFHLVVTC